MVKNIHRVGLPHGGIKGVSKNTVLMDTGLDYRMQNTTILLGNRALV